MNLLVTGGCGFLGSHFIRRWIGSHPDDTITNVDSLTYAGSLDNLEDVRQNPRHRQFRVDIADAAALQQAWPTSIDLVVHFAAETHVDRSLEQASFFVKTNVLGTLNLLSCAMTNGSPSVIVISSDEVYGPTPKGQVFGVGEPLRPTSPYAVSKAAADWMALAYARSHGLDVTIIRSVNVFGPRQYPEKFIPLFVTRALAGEPLPLYGSGRQRRSWLYVDDFVDGVLAILSDPQKRRERPIWHLGSSAEMENRKVAEAICNMCGVDPGLIKTVPDRPGHDQRYALDDSQTRRVFGWAPRISFADGLRQTVEWIRANQNWCRDHAQWRPSFLIGDTPSGGVPVSE